MIRNALEDSFEKLVEQGATQSKKVVKSAGQQIKQTFSPTKMWEELLGVSSSVDSQTDSVDGTNKKTESVVKNGGKHTPLNLEKLGKSYQNSEKQKQEQLKQHLFRLVKEGEEKLMYERKKEEQEKKQREIYELQEKRKKEEEKRKQQAGDIPQGKVRRSIFSHKKVAERSHTETKPASGKQ